MERTPDQFTDRTRGLTADTIRLGNPLDYIAEDHMREREVCALLDRLVEEDRLGDVEMDRVLSFLNEQLPQHLEDEEVDLFPLMLARCEPEDEIDRVIARLQFDHGHAVADAPKIAALIAPAMAERTALSQTACAQVTRFADFGRRHLILENAVILPIARARLTSDDLAVMRRHMMERRGINPEEEGARC